MTDFEAEVLSMLTEIRDQVSGLRADLAGRPLRPLSQTDEKALRFLLPTIEAAIDQRTFTVRELFKHAALDVESAVALREALASVGSSRKIGRLLRRGNAVDVDGYRVVANGHSREGMLLSITAKTRKTHFD